MDAAPITNALTLDIEDYFQVSAFASHIDRDDRDTLPCRVERNVDRILAILVKDFQWDRMDKVFLNASDEPACA